MRIKGGPRAGATGRAKASGGASKAAGTRFSGLVNNDPQDNEEKARDVRSRLLEELEGLAEELEDGTSTKEEASRKFVGLVIRDRYGEQKSKGGKQMEETIGEMVESDPNFVSRLSSQLKRLAKS